MKSMVAVDYIDLFNLEMMQLKLNAIKVLI
jgi:hypothetical protein